MLDVRTALRRAACFNQDRTAVVHGDHSLTYDQAWRRGLRLANALLDLGLSPGDRVAVLEDNVLASSDFFLGTAAANFVRVPLYKRNSRAAHRHMLDQTQCRAVVVSEDQYPELAGLDDELPHLRHVIVRDAGYEQWLAGHRDDDPDPVIDADDLYVIRHSAGTTGRSKGIAFSHRAWMNTERNWTFALPPMELGDACTHVAPISHGSGYLFVPTWLAGGCNILESRFTAERVLELMSKRGGYLFLVPAMVADVLAEAAGREGDYDFSALKALVVSGAPIRPRTALAARDLFGPRLYQMFGQTECVPAAFMGPREWFGDVPGSEPLKSCGRVLPYTELEIRDERNRPLPVGEAGEITIRSDGQMVLIWDDPALTAKRMVDGWILTGDIGRLDANGYLYLHDRKDDMIISGGFNIWPAELELVIAALPGVREVIVFGVPHAKWGETPLARVVLEPGAELTEEEVIEACREELGSYKKPSIVELTSEALPRTPVGKISRSQLREPYWAKHESPLGAL